MTALRVLITRLIDPFLSRRRDARLREEVAGHLQMLADDYVSAGMSRADAEAAARRAFGGVDQMQEAYRDQRGLPLLDMTLRDLRFALRLLVRDRGFAITALLVLATGIGVNNMLFTILNAHTMRGLPLADVDRVMLVSTADGRGGFRGLTAAEASVLGEPGLGVTGVGAFTSGAVDVEDGIGPAERLDAAFTSAGAFAVLGLHPLAGREIEVADGAVGAAPVALAGDRFSRERYGTDTAGVARTLRINGRTTTIVGVVPERGGFPATAQLWLPLPSAAGFSWQSPARTLTVFARLGEDATVAQAQQEIEGRFDRLDHPRTPPETQVRPVIAPINTRYLGRITDPAWLAFATVSVLVLLISCANVANLMLARAVARSRELAIRAAIGASRRRLLFQLLVEGALLAAGGGVLGLGVATLGVRLFRSAVPQNALPYWLDYSLDLRVLFALVAVSALTLFVFALVPAVRTSKADVQEVLKDGARQVVGARGTRRWTTVFLSAEFALTVVLLAQFAVTLRGTSPELPSDVSLNTRRILTALVTLPPVRYGTPESRTQLVQEIAARFGRVPGAVSVAFASQLPFSGATERRVDTSSGSSPAAELRTTYSVMVSPGYFATLGQPLVRGREFDARDIANEITVAILNERAAELWFPGADPIGRSITLRDAKGQTPIEAMIVGIARTIRQRPVPVVEPIVYIPLRAAETPAGIGILVASGADAAALTTQLRRELQGIDAALPLYRIRTMAGVINDLRWNGRLSAALFNALVLIAVGLSTVGLYAVTAYFVGQRTQEIGLRMALGASPSRVVRLVARRAAVQLAIGFAAGIVCVVLWDSAFSPGRPGLKATDPQSLAIVGAILCALAAVACAAPSLRAARLNPVDAIRHD